jgi:hypothetical protein
MFIIRKDNTSHDRYALPGFYLMSLKGALEKDNEENIRAYGGQVTG